MLRYIIKALLLSVSLLLLGQMSALAEETEKEAALFETSDWHSYMAPVEQAQQTMGYYVQSFGEQVDSFFGDESLQAVSKGSKIVVYTPFIWDDGEFSQPFHIKAEFDLPKTNHRWKLLFSNANDEAYDSPLESAAESKRNSNNGENQLAGRYLLQSDENQFSHFEVGMRFNDVIDPNPYARYLQRYRYALSENWLSRSTQQFEVERIDGFSWDAEQIFDYKQSATRIWRSQSQLYYKHAEEGWFFNQSALWLEQTSANTAVAYYLDSNWWLHQGQDPLQQVSIGANWRSRLYKDWLYGEVEPQIYWTHADDFNQPLYRIRLQLEVHFYEPR